MVGAVLGKILDGDGISVLVVASWSCSGGAGARAAEEATVGLVLGFQVA